MNGIPIRIGKLPIALVCWSNGCVSFEKLYSGFPTIIDQLEQGIQAILSDEDIAIGAETVVEYSLLYEYKQMPELLAWLKAQKLQSPF